MRFKNISHMSKKKSDTEKKPKEAKASKAAKKVAGKSVKKAKSKPEAAAIPAVPVAEAPAVETKPPAVAPVEKPKLNLPKKPAQIKRAPVTISAEDISLRAYFIAERRNLMGWPGDETSDWVEAERQLVAEAAKKPR